MRAPLFLALVAVTALADPNDFHLYKLGQPGCDPTNPGDRVRCDKSANAKFRVFAREFGAALSSVNLMPPESLGHAGFYFGAELSVVDLKSGTDFVMPTANDWSNGALLIPSVHVRKGLPFSFELGARTAWIEKSRMGAGTIEVKWSVNEGFAYLPDIGVRGYGVRLFNTRDFGLTTAGLDVGVGKQFAIGGMITLTPYVGWNLVWVSASSNNVDFKPERSKEDAEKTGAAQLTNTTVFDEVKLGANSHNRFYGGLRFIGGVVQIGAEVSYSSLGRFQDKDSGTEKAMPDVATFNTTLGLDF
jgi:hypothetical protein